MRRNFVPHQSYTPRGGTRGSVARKSVRTLLEIQLGGRIAGTRARQGA